MNVTKFVNAAADGNVEELITLLDRGRVDINAINSSGDTALMQASSWGREAAVQLLLTRGAKLNLKDGTGNTALMLACDHGYLSIAELLLRSGADLSLQNKAGNTALIDACQIGDLSIAELLLRSGADHSHQNEDGRTALIDACERGHLSIAELLVRSGADHSHQDKDGGTALMYACFEGHLSIAELLVRSGADHSLQSKKNRNTALHLACGTNYIAVAELLLGRGANYSCRNNDGKTPIERCENLEARAKIQGFIDALALSSTPVQAVPAEWDAIALEHAVQKAIAMKEKCWNRSKIMLVGQGRAGKSSIARVILGHDFNAESPSTCGIDKFEVNVCTGLVQHAQGSSQCQWQEYKKQGSHLNNALASMAENLAEQADARQDIPGSNSESTQKQIVHGSSESNPGMIGAESSPQIPPELASDNKSGTSITESVPQPIPLPELPFDVSLIAKTQVVKDSDLLLSLFDFGGQEIFNCVHPFFLTENGAYLVVFNMIECLDPTTQQECLRVLMFWVNSIAMHTKRGETKSGMTISDIYIVGTRKDQVGNQEHLQTIDTLLIETLSASVAWRFVQKEEPYVFFPVACTLGMQDAVARKLMRNIECHLKQSPFVLSKRPLTWFSVLDDLEALGSSKSMISLGEVEAKAEKYRIEKEELVSLLRFFREMGVLLWYEEPSCLRDAVILDPIAHFIKPVTRIICDPELHAQEVHTACRNTFSHSTYQTFRNTGVADADMLKFILAFGDNNFTSSIEMLRLYGLLVLWDPAQLSSAAAPGEYKYLVPSLFSNGDHISTSTSMTVRTRYQEITLAHETLSHWGDRRTFFLVFSLDAQLSKTILRRSDLQLKCFLPDGIFDQLMCSVLVWSQNTPGSRLENCKLQKWVVETVFGNVKFCMTLRSRHNCIQVDVLGDGQQAQVICARLTALVNEIIGRTHSSIFMEPFVSTSSQNAEILVSCKSLLGSAAQLDGVDIRPETICGQGNFCWIISQHPQTSVFDVFLSYRWNDQDSALVNSVFDHLQDYSIGARKISVYLDYRVNKEADTLRLKLFKSLFRSTVVVPFITSRSLERMGSKYDASKIDNLLFEWITIVLLIKLRPTTPHRIALEKIMPTFVNDPNGNLFVDVFPGIVQVHPTITMAEVLTSFAHCKINLPPEVRDFASTVTVHQIVSAMQGFIYANGDCISDHHLPCRVAARAVTAVDDTEAFAWSQLDLMTLLTGGLERYRKEFEENQVTVEVIRMCNLDDPETLAEDIGVSMTKLDAKLFLQNLKEAVKRI